VTEYDPTAGRKFADLSPDEQRLLLEAHGEPARDYHPGFDPEPQRGYEPIQPQGNDWRAMLRRIFAPIIAIGAFVVKYGAFALKGKFFFGIFISFGFYLWYGGLWFAVGLIVLLFVHEMGHLIEAKRQGLDVSAPMFIPFLGAAILLRENPRDAWHEARIALAGPLLGSAGAAVIYALGAAEDSNRLKGIAFLGFFLNLFNLLPVVPLDGGRAVAALHPALWAVGFAALVALAVLRPNGILILIVLFSGMELWRRWQSRDHPEMQSYYRVLPWQRIAVAVTYFGLAALLVLGMHASQVPHSSF
jgi:Zn-dependent protease